MSWLCRGDLRCTGRAIRGPSGSDLRCAPHCAGRAAAACEREGLEVPHWSDGRQGLGPLPSPFDSESLESTHLKVPGPPAARRRCSVRPAVRQRVTVPPATQPAIVTTDSTDSDSAAARAHWRVRSRLEQPEGRGFKFSLSTAAAVLGPGRESESVGAVTRCRRDGASDGDDQAEASRRSQCWKRTQAWQTALAWKPVACQVGLPMPTV